MTHYTMETIGNYWPLVNHGNTIRKMSDKYIDIQPGDTVTMIYRPFEGGVVLAKERLSVRAVVIGPFEEMVYYHWENNHSADRDAVLDMEVIYKTFENLYGPFDSVHDDFVVIYFH